MSKAETEEVITRVYASELLTSYDASGEWSLTDEKQQELMEKFGLNMHTAAAHTFLGKVAARNLLNETAREIALMEYGIYE